MLLNKICTLLSNKKYVPDLHQNNMVLLENIFSAEMAIRQYYIYIYISQFSIPKCKQSILSLFTLLNFRVKTLMLLKNDISRAL